MTHIPRRCPPSKTAVCRINWHGMLGGCQCSVGFASRCDVRARHAKCCFVDVDSGSAPPGSPSAVAGQTEAPVAAHEYAPRKQAPSLIPQGRMGSATGQAATMSLKTMRRRTNTYMQRCSIVRADDGSIRAGNATRATRQGQLLTRENCMDWKPLFTWMVAPERGTDGNNGRETVDLQTCPSRTASRIHNAAWLRGEGR